MSTTAISQPGSKLRQVIYLVLCLAGTLLTQRENFSFIQANGGFDLSRFIADASQTAAGRSLSWDLVIGATAGVMAMVVESKRLAMRHAIWPILLSFTVAFAAGAPLFLLLRERHLNQQMLSTPELSQ
jgi:hypothetical protein